MQNERLIENLVRWFVSIVVAGLTFLLITAFWSSMSPLLAALSTVILTVFSLFTIIIIWRGVMDSETRNAWASILRSLGRWLLTIAVLAIAVGLMVFGPTVLIERSTPPQISLTYVLIGGVIILFSVLAVISLILNALKLSDASQALGLPQGSVRALIALLLVLIFSILSIHLFSLFISGRTEVSEGITQAQLDLLASQANGEIIEIDAVEPTEEGGEILYNVVIRSPLDEAAQDLGNQILTTISTLVVSVASFYFGARSVSMAISGSGQAAANLPVINGVSLNTGKSGTPVSFEISGSNFSSPSVKLVKGRDTIEAVISSWEAGKINCSATLILPAGAVPGVWDVVVKNEDGTEARLSAFEITT